MQNYFKTYLQSLRRMNSTAVRSRRRKSRRRFTASFVEGLETRQLLTGDIAGTVFDDANQNGVMDPGENGLAGWTMFVDRNSNGTLDAGEPSQVTNVDGDYLFTGLPNGVNRLFEIPQGGYAPIPGHNTYQNVTVLDQTEVRAEFPNSIAQVGSIDGVVWNDLNGDGLQGPTESGLSGWTVFLDDNNNGTRDATEPMTLTDAAGYYAFPGVSTGDHRVREVLQTGWSLTDGHDVAYTTTVTLGGNSVVDFYNLTPAAGSVAGTVWNDLNNNGTFDAGEPGLAAWQVYDDVNNNGALDAGEPSATTDASGAYTIYGVAYGSATITEVAQPGWLPTNPATGSTSVYLLNGDNLTAVSFGNHEPQDAVIHGTAFNDKNKNGIRDAGEAGLSGITVFLDANNNGTLDPTELSTTTSADLYYTPAIDEAGTYSFSHLPKGTYQVREILPAEQSATPPAVIVQPLTVGPTDLGTIDFANQFRPNEIHGTIFDDLNGDHIHDPGEPGRNGVTVFIDLNRDNLLDPGEPTATTATDGSYSFQNLIPGAYVVREVVDPSRSHSYPTTTGGTLWPTGTSNPAVGNVTPGTITTSLATGQSYRTNVSLTLPGSGGITNMVDVFLLFDDTGSFTSNSPIVRSAFPTIISSLQTALPGVDLGFGVGRFEEYANYASEYATGRPFILNQPIVASSTSGFSTSIQAALDRTAPGYGGDTPETDVEALYQLVTGNGFDGNNNGNVTDSGAAGLASTQLTPGNSGDVPAFSSFTVDPANNVLPAAGNIGGGGFRPGALPIILTATDTGFAYQPKGETSITGSGGITLPVSELTQSSRASTPYNAGAGIQETVTGLNALGALVIGLGTNPETTLDPRQDLSALAKLTGAVNRSTSTIANGTATPIAPGDPFYFQISTGFGSTVADGIVNAIQNAVTSVAMDITVKASDPRVHIINHTGTATGVAAGQTSNFDVEFVGDGIPHRFDLQFVRAGTNVVLGSIPVVLGTPVPGDGYDFEDLPEGEIRHGVEFGDHLSAPNHAPVLNNVGNPSFPAIPEDVLATANSGLSISQLITAMAPGGITDADSPALQGIAVDSAPTLSGAWQYSSDNGTTWQDVGTVDLQHSLLLPASAGWKMRFSPAANFNGTSSIDFFAWDQTSGSAGTRTDATTRGAATSFSANSETAPISVTPINDAPVLNTAGSPKLNSIPEDTLDSANLGTTIPQLIASLTSTGGSISDVDAAALQGIAVTAVDQTHGIWQFTTDNGLAWTDFGTPSGTAARLLAANANTRIRFRPAQDFNGNATFTFVAWDQTAGANGGAAVVTNRGGTKPYSLAYDSASITVTPVNDAPVLNAAGTPSLNSMIKNTADAANTGTAVSQIIANLTATGGSISDVDTAALRGIAVTSLDQTHGTWQFTTDNGTTWTDFGTTSAANARLLASVSGTKVRFKPALDYVGNATFLFVAWDQSAGTNGGTLSATNRGGVKPFSLAYDSAVISVLPPPNAAPILNAAGTPRVTSIPKNTLDVSNVGTSVADLITSLAATGGSITDTDPGALQGIAVTSVDQTHGIWQFTTDNGVTWTDFGSPAASSARLLAASSSTRVRFKPATDFVGTATFLFVAWDQSAGLNGGTLSATKRGGITPFSLAADTAIISVT